MRSMVSVRLALTGSLLGLASLSGLGGCASSTPYIYGTKVEDNAENRRILGVVEQYRLAVERRDTSALLAMAAPGYWEDGGTPTGSDDYGIEGLRDALANRFSRADNIRYSMRYMAVRRLSRTRAAIEVLVDASYTIATARGAQRLDMRDQNEMVLEFDGRNWKFVSGM
jgi:hypothetical protein